MKTQTDLGTLGEFFSGDYAVFGKDNTLTGVYTGFHVEDDPFKPGMQRLVYHLEIDGKVKNLAKSSRRLWKAMMKAEVKEGNEIRITRTGSGFETNYFVEVL